MSAVCVGLGGISGVVGVGDAGATDQKKVEDNKEKKHPIRCSEGPGSGPFEEWWEVSESLPWWLRG